MLTRLNPLNFGGMSHTTPERRSVNWYLIASLGTFALIRPLVRIIATQADLQLPAVVPVVLTLTVTGVWVAAVMVTRTDFPVLTLVLAGITYAVLATLLSAALSPVLDGSLAGPLANPVTVIPVILVNVLWGLLAGGLALVLIKLRSQ